MQRWHGLYDGIGLAKKGVAIEMFASEKGWQPYPHHPQIRALMEELATIKTKAELALEDGLRAADLASAVETIASLERQRTAIKETLQRVTDVLVQDPMQKPRWLACKEGDKERGAMDCFTCGSLISRGESNCSYCRWTYLDDSL